MKAGPLGPAHGRRARFRGSTLIIVAVAVVGLAGCAATGAPVMPPLDAPPASTGGCSPGWSPGADGRCQRDPSNFGGPPIYFGPQASRGSGPSSTQRLLLHRIDPWTLASCSRSPYNAVVDVVELLRCVT